MSPAARRCALALLLAAVTAPCNVAAIVLPPLPARAGEPDAAVVVIRDDAHTAADYAALGQALQLASATALRVAIPDAAESPLTAAAAGRAVDAAVHELQAAGFPAGSAIVALGHFRGGFALQEWLSGSKGTAMQVSGQVLLESFLQRRWRPQPSATPSRPFRVPTLSVAGELDGEVRITRFAEAMYHQIGVEGAAPRPDAAYFPIAVVEGMTHGQAAGAPAAGAERGNPEVLADVATAVAAFTDALTGRRGAAALERVVARASALLQPLVEAMVLEGSEKLAPPCNDAPPSASCTTGSPWTAQVAQPFMGGLQQGGVVEAQDHFHPAAQLFPYHHPTVDRRCAEERNCTVAITTVTQNIYAADDKDVGAVPLSSSSMRMKLISRQQVWQAAGHADASFEVLDAQSLQLCSRINQRAIDWALQRLTPAARQRYQLKGEQLVVGDDLEHNLGPDWIWIDLTYTRERQGTAGAMATVARAPSLSTSTSYPISILGGFHFCKGLSPFRALEWMLVDALRVAAQ